MAKQTARPVSDDIREALDAGILKPSAIVEHLAKKGITATTGNVNAVKQAWKAKKPATDQTPPLFAPAPASVSLDQAIAEAAAFPPATQSGNIVEVLNEVEALAVKVGGMDVLAALASKLVKK